MGKRLKLSQFKPHCYHDIFRNGLNHKKITTAARAVVPK